MNILKRTIPFILLLILSLPLAACSPKPEATVTSFFDAIHQSDITKVSTFLKKDGTKGNFNFENKEQEQMLKAIFSKAKCEIISTQNNGKTAVVKAKVTSLDVPKIFGITMTDLIKTAFAAALSDDSHKDDVEKQASAAFLKGLNDPKAPLTTTEVDIKLEKGNNGWLIDPSDDFLNALTGNFGKAFDKFKEADRNSN